MAKAKRIRVKMDDSPLDEWWAVSYVLAEYGGAHAYVATIGGAFTPIVLLVLGDSWEDAWENLLDHASENGPIWHLVGVDESELTDDERAQLERGEMLPGYEYNASGGLVSTDWLDMQSEPIF